MFLLSGGYYKNNHSCFLFSVLVKKYRYPCSTDVVKDALLQYTRSYFEQCDCIIQEVNTDKDHVHILFDALPHIHLVKFINSSKSGSSRKIRSTHGFFKTIPAQNNFFGNGVFQPIENPDNKCFAVRLFVMESYNTHPS